MKLIDVCKTPVKMKSIPHVPNTPRLHEFYYPHVHLEMTEYYVKKMECCGYLCDAIGLIGSNNCSEKYCSCYHMPKENGMNLFEFALKVTVLNDEENVSFEFMMKKFTSCTFTHFLTKSGIPLSIGMNIC